VGVPCGTLSLPGVTSGRLRATPPSHTLLDSWTFGPALVCQESLRVWMREAEVTRGEKLQASRPLTTCLCHTLLGLSWIERPACDDMSCGNVSWVEPRPGARSHLPVTQPHQILVLSFAAV
jgi:hypothetical protein